MFLRIYAILLHKTMLNYTKLSQNESCNETFFDSMWFYNAAS